ncbi:hypothetical protein E4F39_03715 [Burkholderia pseudomallei]|nr:hypothetical protein [Burkholderia pseudomallei]MPT70556.1 hypothetical protein [Burkholderia pseudomallei]MPT77762.1 hypothetical protein [Burkholderia pseudomallei]MPT81318.1 hypothetical protein [Burkholderia pseudomallei]MPT92296.1 hypothetical protein [Burkholderia pseudomallei]
MRQLLQGSASRTMKAAREWTDGGAAPGRRGERRARSVGSGGRWVDGTAVQPFNRSTVQPFSRPAVQRFSDSAIQRFSEK